MGNPFFERPILNSPYQYPSLHWELDSAGQPTGREIASRRTASFLTPIPKPRKQKGKSKQGDFVFADSDLSTAQQRYDATIINEVRGAVDVWRQLKDPKQWGVTPETERLLQHWRTHAFSYYRPFFCQVEAAEVAIYLAEVAPKIGKTGQRFLDHLKNVNKEANPELFRIALKLATGAGKTTVMAMLIAWQTLNAARRPDDKNYTRGFLLVTPGLTIKDRLRVLLPNDPESYYDERELVPRDMLAEIGRAKIVITNYHAFKLREKIDISKGGRALLKGRLGEDLQTLETEGQMVGRVMSDLVGLKNILVINDEAHHCYREKAGDPDEEPDAKGDEKEEAEQNREAARLWISGLEAVKRQIGVSRVIDLSATPFFLRGSGYHEGTLFPWVMSDFSLMDAIECGIVKLPRVPVADNIPEAEVPVFRNLWEHVGKHMPKKGRAKGGIHDPLKLPNQLQTALEALYGHYAKTFRSWEQAGIKAPPCFIVVCNNTSASKLVYDFISGWNLEAGDGSSVYVPGRFELFRNSDENGNPYAQPRTLLIDSTELESGDGLDENFRKIMEPQIDRFRREIRERGGGNQEVSKITDQELLREVMNTVGKAGKLGESIRCVVSVSMLTEGWDANTVTHILGVRAFGTQLLCEQVIGRALRRQSYDLNGEGKFDVEYADVLGIPFDFNAQPTISKPQPPRETILVQAVRPDRDHLEIQFPRVTGYRVELPEERLEATFSEASRLVLDPRLVGPSRTTNAGIIGEAVDLNLHHTGDTRSSTVLYHLTRYLIFNKWRDPGEEPKIHLFGQLKRIAKQWLDEHLECRGDTYPAQLLYSELADLACERITAAITRHHLGESSVKAVLDSYNPAGSTMHVRFATSKTDRWETRADRCHVNYAILDSGWEGEFCRIAESHPRVRAYVKNYNLGLEVPYRWFSENRRYLPDFILHVDDGHGEEDLLNLIVEIKGWRGEDAKEKKSTMDSYWIPAVNNLGSYGRWAFAEFTEVYEMEPNLNAKIASEFERVIGSVTQRTFTAA